NAVGRVLVVGGSAGLTGAATLAARAATRAGAGYVQLAVPASLADLFAIKLTEQMAHGMPETRARALDPAAFDTIAALAARGNAGLATAGTGDVLAGAIAALMAQGLTPWNAACLGVYAHGMAGDVLAETRGLLGLAAGDLAETLPEALKRLGRFRDEQLERRGREHRG